MSSITPPSNLFEHIPTTLSHELTEILAEGSDQIRVKRIVSQGHTSPKKFWYDQDSTEWVVLLRGSAVLQFEDQAEPTNLKPGDYLEIAPHRRHRVLQTSTTETTVWLAIFWN